MNIEADGEVGAAENLLTRVPSGAVELDCDHRIAYANLALAEMVGCDAAALHGRPFETLFTTAAGAIFQSYVIPVLALHGHIEEFALSVRTAAGGSVDVLMYARAHGPERRQRISAILAPYQTRKAVDDELLKVKRAADQSPAMMFELVRSAGGRLQFTYASRSVKRLYGCVAQQARAEARRILDQLPAETVARLSAHPAATLPLNAEVLVRAGQPDAAWHEWNALARIESNGTVVWAGSITDVTDRRALYDEAVELRAAAQARRAQSEFLGRVSHELRTPLNAVLGFTQLLVQSADQGASALNRRHLDLIASAGRRLLGLVDDVLDLSSFRAVGFRIRRSPVALSSLVDDSLAIFSAQALRAGVTLISEVPSAFCVDADATRLTQVLDNLISNAIKYNRTGGNVTLRAVSRDGGVALDVRDTGIGMDQAQRRALFQPFNRLGAERLGIEGTGLGLVIAAQIVEAMGGSLTVESAPGRGSCFRVWLPRPQEAEVSMLGIRSSSPSLGTSAPKSCVDVLYVEDDPVNATLFEAIAASVPGMRLLIAESGAKAMVLADETSPSLFLCDRHLPDIEAPALFAKLRSRPHLAELPGIMVSGDAMPEAAASAREAGFIEVWTKPLDVIETRRRLTQLIGALGPVVRLPDS